MRQRQFVFPRRKLTLAASMIGQWANRVILAAVLIGLSPQHEAHSQTGKVWRMASVT